MATDTEHFTSAKWQRLLRQFPTEAPALKQAFQAHDRIEFESDVRKILREKASTVSFDDLWTEMKEPIEGEHHEEEAHEKHDTEHTEETHHPQSKVLEQLKDITIAPLTFFQKTQYLEEDHKYHGLRNRLKKNYLKQHNKKRFDYEDTQDLDFLYGSVDDPNTSVDAAAEKLFHNDPKNQKALKRYDKNKAKVRGGFDKDSYVWQTKVVMGEQAEHRKEALKKQYKKAGKKLDKAFDQDFKSIMDRLRANTWEKFADENPNKAAAYVKKESQKRLEKQKKTKKASHDDDDFFAMQKAHETRLAKAAQLQTQPTPTITTTTPPQKTTPAPVVTPHPTPTKPTTTPVSPTSPSPVTSPLSPTTQPPPVASPTQPVTPPTSSLTVPKPSQNTPSQNVTPVSIPNPTPVTKSPPQIIRPPTQSTPIPQFTRRYIPSGDQTRPGGYSNPMVSMGKNYLHNQASRLTNRMMGSAGKTVGRAAGNAAANVGKKLAARVLMNPYVLAAIGIILLIILLIILIIFIISGTKDSSSTQQPTTIPGLTLSLVGPTQIENSSNIEYTINATYTGTGEVTLSDPLPTDTAFVSATGNFTNTTNTVVWKLTDNDPPGTTAPSSAGTTRAYNFTLILDPEKEDILVKNKIIANAIGGAGPGGPVLTGGSGNACTEKYEGTGYCSVENLKQYFGGDAGKALVASMICQTESTSNPNGLNTNCGTNDYSVGLFQINLVAHCAGAYAGLSCKNLIDIDKRNVCESKYKNPEENIKYMVQLSQNGTKWTDWSAYTSPSIGARKRLAECGIN